MASRLCHQTWYFSAINTHRRFCYKLIPIRNNYSGATCFPTSQDEKFKIQSCNCKSPNTHGPYSTSTASLDSVSCSEENLICSQTQCTQRTTFAYNGPTEISLSSILIKNKSLSLSHKNGGDFGNTTIFSSQALNPYINIGKRFFSSTQPNKETTETQHATASEGNKSKKKQLKIILAQYGAFGMAVHITLSLGFLGLTYLAVYSGVDVQAIFLKFGITMSSLTSGTSTFLIAYAAHKMLLPVRASVSIITVPVLVRYLRRLGYFKK